MSPLQSFLHLKFWEWCVHNNLCYCQSLCLLNWLSWYCFSVCSSIQVKLSCPFSFLPLLSDHLTMSYTFHVALSKETKKEKAIEEGQKIGKSASDPYEVISLLTVILFGPSKNLFCFFIVTCISLFLWGHTSVIHCHNLALFQSGNAEIVCLFVMRRGVEICVFIAIAIKMQWKLQKDIKTFNSHFSDLFQKIFITVVLPPYSWITKTVCSRLQGGSAWTLLLGLSWIVAQTTCLLSGHS